VLNSKTERDRAGAVGGNVSQQCDYSTDLFLSKIAAIFQNSAKQQRAGRMRNVADLGRGDTTPKSQSNSYEPTPVVTLLPELIN